MVITAVCILLVGITLHRESNAARHPGVAHAAASLARPALVNALDSAGTLPATARGTFDPQGLKLHTTASGAPVFQAATTAVTGTWDTRFANALPFTGTINTLVMAPSGDLYIGGRFSRIHNVQATSVARWDGSTWSALGTDGSNGGLPFVYTIAVDGTDVYVGGEFQFFGGVVTENVAHWDGTAWHAVGSDFEPNEPFTSSVWALAAFQDELLIAGDFTSFNGVPAAGFVHWDGAVATPITSGLQIKTHMAVTSQGVYISSRGPLGESYAFSLMLWDGTTFAPVPDTSFGSIYKLQVMDDELYMLGRFTWTGGGPASLRLAKWNGAAWTMVTPTLPSNSQTFAVSTQALYVADETTIYQWNGSAWQPYLDCSSCYYNLAIGPDALYVTNPYRELLRYNGSQLEPVAVVIPPDATMNAHDGIAYVGVYPVMPNHLTTDHLLRWQAGTWTNIWPYASDGMWLASPVIAEDGTLYIIAGEGGTLPKIYRYRNNSLQIVPNQPSILMGGLFISGTNLLTYDLSYLNKNVYLWSGTAWITIPGPTNAGQYAETLFVLNGQIYYITQDAQPASPPHTFISRWTGTTWVTVGPPLSGWINTVAVTADAAYLGGTFQTTDGTIRNIARWDGADLQGLGNPNGRVESIAVRGTVIYAGGRFSQIGTCACTNLGRWNGSTWEPLGSGTNGSVSNIAVDGYDVYVQGLFSLAGDLPALGISIWHEHDPDPPTPTATPTIGSPTPTATPATESPTPTAPTPTSVTTAEWEVYLPLLLR